MKLLQNKFLRSLAVLTAILAIAGAGLASLLPTTMNPHWVWILLLFTVITPAIFFLMLGISDKKPNRFTNYFMVSSMLKLLLLLLLILVYSLVLKEHAISFTITLLTLYCIHLIFEIYWLMQFSRKGNVKKDNNV